MCQVYVCTAQDVVLCVGQASLRVSCCVVLWLGRSHAEGRQPPNPKGWTSRSRCTSHSGPTSWAPVQRESRTVRPISLAFLGVQQTVGRQSTRATPWIARRQAAFSPQRRASPRLIKRQLTDLKAAPSNASAASESTTAGGLEAFSQGTAGTERFENASSRLRWSLRTLLSLFMRWNPP